MMDGSTGGAGARPAEGGLEQLRFKALFVFSGVGGGALGFQRAQAEFRRLGVVASFEVLAGIELDESTAKDFTRLTGAPCLVADVAHLTARFLRDLFGDDPPDVVFFSPPCKPASGLLAKKIAATTKYREMAMLGADWTRLMFEAWPTGPKLLIMENVPRITTRAPEMMAAIRAATKRHRYFIHEDSHDCGELGALAQHRDRLLFVARRRDVPALLYQPVKKRVRAIGEVLGRLPLPGDAAGGRLHRLPKIEAITALRLALIPAGGDWSNLPSQVVVPPEIASALAAGKAKGKNSKSAETARKAKGTAKGPSERTPFNDVYRVVHFDEPAPCVTAGATPSAGGISVADPRVGRSDPDGARGDDHGVIGWDQPAGAITGRSVPSCGKFSVQDPRAGRSRPDRARNDDHGVIGWCEPSGTITGNSCPTNGRFSVADPRPGDGDYARYGNNWHVESWDEAAHCITGSTDIQNGAPSVADPRPVKECHPHTYGVLGWGQAAHTITGNCGTPGCGPFSVAEPRVDGAGSGGGVDPRPGRPSYPNTYGVLAWGDTAPTITGNTKPGGGAFSVAEPRVDGAVVDARITCKTFKNSGIYGVLPWTEPSGTIVAHACHDNGRFSVADPRWPETVPFPVIISEDGTWHRPLTALECAALQGFDAFDAEGRPLELDGPMDAVRVKIGDAVPVTTACAIGRQMLFTLVDAAFGNFSLSSGGEVWVRERDAAGYEACPTVDEWGTA